MSYEFNSQLSSVLIAFMKKVKAESAESTAVKYQIILNNFDGFLCSEGFSSQFLPDSLLADWICSLSGLSNNTIVVYETAVSRFLDFAKAFGISSHMPPVMKWRDEYQPELFSREDIDTLCRIADNYTVDHNKKLPWVTVEIPMIIRLLFGCGLRLSETLEIQMRDINLKLGVITMRRTKRSKERLVPMTSERTDILHRYCMAIGAVGNPDYYIFPSDSFSNHLTKMNVYHRFCKILKECGLSSRRTKKNERKLCIHCIRHSFVVYAIKHLRSQGISIDDTFPYLSVYMGHATLYDTQKYMKFSAELFPEETSRFDSYSTDVYACRIFHLDDEVWE